MAKNKRRARARRRQGLRIEFGDGQQLFAKVFPGHRLHLFGGDRLQLFDHAPVHRVRNPGGFELSDFHGLGEHRVELVDLPGNELRLRPPQFVGSHSLLLHTREFGSQITNVLRCLELEAHGYQVTVTELVGWEHSMKNELILARKVGKGKASARERLQQVLDELGLQELQQRFGA